MNAPLSGWQRVVVIVAFLAFLAVVIVFGH